MKMYLCGFSFYNIFKRFHLFNFKEREEKEKERERNIGCLSHASQPRTSRNPVM